MVLGSLADESGLWRRGFLGLEGRWCLRLHCVSILLRIATMRLAIVGSPGDLVEYNHTYQLE